MATASLKLYTPHKIQRQLHNSPYRFNVTSWGRQSGKSTYGINKVSAKGWEKRNGIYWYVSPTYNQAKILYRRLKRALGGLKGSAVSDLSDSEFRIDLLSKSSIFFKSGDKPDNLRTETLDGVVVDEVRDQSPDLWNSVLSPMLATTGGWADFISTPNGFDHFYDLAQLAKSDTSGEWGFFNAPSIANPFFRQTEFERCQREMSDDLFAQEILALFRNLTAGLAYKNFSERNLSVKNPFVTGSQKYSPYLPIIVACDFNVSPMAWTLGQQRGDKIHWVEEIWVQTRTNTYESGEELVERVKGHQQGLIIIGDASGNASDTTSASNKSDYDILFDILQKNDIEYQNLTPESNPSIRDRVNTLNSRLLSYSGEVCTTINPQGCPKLVRDLERVSWKKGSSTHLDDKTDRTLTHSSDGVGYATCVLAPLKIIDDMGVAIIYR